MNMYTLLDIRTQHRDTTERARAFLDMSLDHLNHKPMQDAWSSAQCFEHMTFVGKRYLKSFQRIVQGKQRTTLWMRFSPLTMLWNRLFLYGIDPDNAKKLTAPSVAEPSRSNLSHDTVKEYLALCEEFTTTMDQLNETVLRSTVITSPIARVITLTAFVALQVVMMHNERHLRQAERAVRSREK
jgi:hypothetical protein